MHAKGFLLLCTGLALSASAVAQTQREMAAVYEAAQTPYKYGLVVVPKDGQHMTDCPTVFRMAGRWYMTYVIFDGRGYETWLSVSDDLLHWQEVGCLLPFRAAGWDRQQRAGFPALLGWDWDDSDHTPGRQDGRYWMSCFGGENKGYEAQPLSIGMAWTDADAFERKLLAGRRDSLEWQMLDRPVLSPSDSTAQWWEKGTHYKPLVYRDPERTLGHEYVLYYNAYGRHPESGLGAERIGLALSDDLLHWSRFAGNPVFSHETKGTITGDAQIVRFRKGSATEPPLYAMFYFRAFDPSRPYKAYNTFSCSHDLVHWVDWQGDDLIHPTEAYDDLFSHKTFILKWQGVVYHFFCAVDRDSRRGIAVATSVDFGRSEVHFPHPFRFGNGFTDHVVLQSGEGTLLWGEAKPGRAVTVRLGRESYTATADGHGQWQVPLRRHRASSRSYTLSAVCEGEPDTLRLADVVFGDVWLATGLSADTANLARLGLPADSARLGELVAGKYQLRTLTPPKKGDWPTWTVVGKVTGKPLGIISATAPGSKLKSWTSGSGKWSRILLKPLSPFAVKGILWYGAPSVPTAPDALRSVRDYLRSTLQSPAAEFVE